MRARAAEKSSEILNAQLPGLFREMHRATRHARSRRTYGQRDGGTEGRPTGQRQRKRREDACGDTGCIPSLLSRVSIQRSNKKRAGRRAFEFSSQTCIAGEKKNDTRRGVILPHPLACYLAVLSRVIVSASRFTGVHCESSLKSALLSILEDTAHRRWRQRISENYDDIYDDHSSVVRRS